MENTVKENQAEELETSGAEVEEKASAPGVNRYLRYLIFIVCIGLVYVWNSHFAEKQLKREDDLKKEIGEAKAEFRTIHARLSSGTRKSVISSKVDTLGLKVLDVPPFKLVRTIEQ
jgi:hypothetical protein